MKRATMKRYSNNFVVYQQYLKLEELSGNNSLLIYWENLSRTILIWRQHKADTADGEAFSVGPVRSLL